VDKVAACTWHVEENAAVHRRSSCLLEVPGQMEGRSLAAEMAQGSQEDQKLT